MCTEAEVWKDGNKIYCETVGELAAALGVAITDVSDDPAENCLCNARWDALGARRAKDKEGFPYPEYIIERSNAK
ncbi:MAG: hypothetical protein V4567_11225 [Pseudomonadota bacterium]